MTREMSFYFATLVLFTSSITFIIPDLIAEVGEHNSIEKVIDSIRVIETKHDTGRIKYTENTLKITATDDYEIYISKENLIAWDSIINSDLEGKKLNVVLRNSNNGNRNPIEVKIDGKVITRKIRVQDSSYLILGFTLLFIIYSIYLINRRLKKI